MFETLLVIYICWTPAETAEFSKRFQVELSKSVLFGSVLTETWKTPDGTQWYIEYQRIGDTFCYTEQSKQKFSYASLEN